MSTEVVLEGNLRPVYEYRVAACAIVLAGILYYIAPYLNISVFWKWVIISGMLALAFRRYRQGRKVRQYQIGLNFLEPYFIKTSEIPNYKGKTWIGRGFVWTGKHAQRVHDAKKEHLKKFYQLSLAYRLARQLEEEVALSPDPSKYRAWLADVTKKARWTLVRKFEVFGVNFKGISVKNPIAPYFDLGGKSYLHGSGSDEEIDQFIDIDERNGNLIVLGQSRVGKTRLLEVLVTADIERDDGPVGVFDPKTDTALLARMWAEAKRCGRDDRFYVYLLGMPEISAKYNSIGNFTRMTAVAGRISDEMSGGGDSAVFRDFAWRFLLVCASTLVEMGEKPTIKLLKRYIENLESLFIRYAKFTLDKENPFWRDEYNEAMKPQFKKNASGEMVEVKIKAGVLAGRAHETIVMDKLLTDFYERNPTKINDTMESLRSALRNDQNYYNKITASLVPLLVKLTSGRIAELISPDYGNVRDNRPVFRWEKAIQRNAIFYCGFDAMTDATVADAVGSQFFGDFVSTVAGTTYKFGVNYGMDGALASDITPIWVHMDEFQSLIGSDSIISILNRAAGSGMRLTAYSQTTDDIIEAFGGDQAKANVVLGNFNSVIMLRVAKSATAEYLTDKIGSCDLYSIAVKGSVTDGGKIFKGDGVDRKKEKLFSTSFSAGATLEATEPLITPATIMSLPKGQAFAYLNGQRLVKLRFPMLEDSDGYEVDSVEVVYDQLKRRYRLGEYAD